MTVSVGTRLGSYEIVSALGAGGMGEVYRAHDTKLNRHVAIKVLPDLFASDPERLARFHREAQVLASLNHPNIAHIHGFEDAGGIHALVMELVEGPTLAERIAQGPIPIGEALAIAKQIALALETAHEQGIIHRDLKPANVNVREDGTVKVLDFGLAKLVTPETGTAGAGSLSHSPTLTTPAATLPGVLLGTAAYMSPEQAKGRPADKRSDVWAFGAVLYEMLTGRRAFGPSTGPESPQAESRDEGDDDLADTLATVLKSDPDWTVLPAEVPPHIRLLVQRCLVKDRRQRMADISVALFVLTEAASLAPAAVAGGPAAARVRPPLWLRFVIPATAAIVAGAAVGWAVWFSTRPPGARITRFSLTPTGTAALSLDLQSRDVAITPDGNHVVYKAAGGSTTQILVRALDALEPTPLVGLGTPRAPFISHDGQWIGFVDIAPVSIKKVAITGGAAILLCPLDGPSRGATWGSDDSIIFATGALPTGLQRVGAAGGKPEVLTKPDRERGEADHLWPQFLPGSQAVLFTITAPTGGIDASQVAVLDLRTGTQKILVRGGSQAHYVSSGHLVYVASGSLRAVAFDPARLETTGTAVTVLSPIVLLPTGTAEFDISSSGTLVYAAGGGGAATARTLVWADRQGREEAVRAAPARAYLAMQLSPDAARVALEIRDQQNDVWVWDFARETLTRITSDPGFDGSPAWMPDGKRVLFSSQAAGAIGSIFWQAADGTGVAERLTQSPNVQRPSSVSPDGTRLLFWEGAGPTAVDVMMLTLDQDRRVQPLVRSSFSERNAEISPDGRWLAYESNDSGENQIFVRPFPDANAGKSQVSTGGGTQPLWARNRQELFYFAPDGALMSVPVGRGAAWTAGTPAKLLDARYYRGIGNITGRTYDASPDGKRFLMIKQASDPDQTAAPASIVVVQNWVEELKRLVPTSR